MNIFSKEAWRIFLKEIVHDITTNFENSNVHVIAQLFHLGHCTVEYTYSIGSVRNGHCKNIAYGDDDKALIFFVFYCQVYKCPDITITLQLFVQ